MSDFNLIDIVDLLEKAQDIGIKISYDDNELILQANKEKVIDKSFLSELKNNKDHLITYFKYHHQDTAGIATIEKSAAIDRTAYTHIPLSFSQERLWIIDQLEGSVQYHLPAALRLKGPLDRRALHNALRDIVNRHEILRTVIRRSDEDDKPWQYILDKDRWQLTIIEESEYRKEGATLKPYIEAPFDLAKDHMLRAHLIILGETEHILLITLHHIVSDGWSTGILINELVELYDAHTHHRIPELAPLNIQYADYAIWQREHLTGTLLEEQLRYWKDELAGVAPLDLPLDYTRPAVQRNRGTTAHFALDKELSVRLKQLSRQQDATLFMTLLAAFKVLLYRYSGQEDICIGSPISGRTREEMEGLIGLFVNTLALRSDLGNDPSFTGLLQQVKDTTLSAYDHQEIPFEKIVEAVVKGRDPGRSPLFQVMFALQNTPPAKEAALGELILSAEDIASDSVKFDLSVVMEETTDGLKGSIEYCTDLFNAATIGRLLSHFNLLLYSITNDPAARISTLPLLTEAEQQQLLFAFNDTTADFPLDKTMPDLFAEQVLQQPDAIALIAGEESVSYKTVEERSNQLAHYLKDQGVTASSLVPVCLERSTDLIIAMLAIMKTGAAYVPVDPAYPPERIRYMLEDTGAPLIISNVILESIGNVHIIQPDKSRQEISRYPVTALPVTATPDSLAYVIYTSGSTGQPKGVLIAHRGLANLVHWHNERYEVASHSKATAVSGVGFDAFGWEIWPYLATGAAVCIVDDDTRISMPALVELHRREGITHAFISTALVQEFIREGEDKINALHYLLTGGDKLPATDITRLSYKVANNYGPTENTVVTTSYDLLPVNRKQAPVIGYPVSNTKIYIINSGYQLCPVGVAGEICVAGVGLSSGYLNRPELTAEKFVDNPFEGGRMYKTGDLGRWLPDGTIEYLGRTDEQVKIRGYRIEPGEIENVLSTCDHVQQAVVTVITDDKGNKRLAGYIVPDGEFDKTAILTYLKNRLPDYMVPAVLIALDKIPLTANGKIDKKALPEPAADTLIANSYEAPRNEAEQVLAGIWQDLLGIKQVGIHDNFFELGGDSIIAIQVVSRAKRAGYTLQPRDLFIHQTIEGLSSGLSSHTGVASGEQGLLTGNSGLLPIQQWFFDTAGATVSHFNQSVLLGIDKSVDTDTLSSAIKKLIQYHDGLRFTYHNRMQGWEQEYGTYEGALEIAELWSKAQITDYCNKFQQSLDIEQGILIRAALLLTPATETHNRLLIVVHHLAIDGVSWRILLEDLQLLLKNGVSGDILGRKSSSYRQWHQALVDYGQRRRALAQLPYWEQVVRKYTPLKTDKRHDGLTLMSDVRNHSVQLNALQTQRLLKEVPRAYHTEINDILLCALAMTLSEWNHTAAIVIGLEGHGREDISADIDTSRTIGWFTNLFPVLLEVEAGKEPGELLKAVKEQLRKINDKGIGYGVLKYINKVATLQGNDPWDIVFNYLGQSDNLQDDAGFFSGVAESSGEDITKDFPLHEKLSVTSLVRQGELSLEWGYSSKHFDTANIEKLAAAYLSHLEALIAHCVSQQTASFTPSDYGVGADITNQELDAFLDTPYKGAARRSQISGLYRLSGLQEGMLFHSLYAEDEGTYTEQMVCEFEDLQVDAFVQSWDHLIARHSILRTAFHYDEFSVPVQCVYKEAVLPVTILDYRSMNEEEQQKAFREFEKNDLRRGFDFKEAPLMRLTLIRLDEHHYRMLWTSHHILLDGWSLPILVGGLLSIYESLVTGTAVETVAEDRYEEYIRYLGRRDKEQAELYWKEYLRHLNEGTLLPFIASTAARTKGVGTYKGEKLILDKTFTNQLAQYAQRQHITLNTLMQGVWAYLLYRYTGRQDVTYGITVSGRPEDLPGVEQGIGLYINTLPLYARVEEDRIVAAWLQHLQADQQQSREHQYTGLNDIQQWSGVQGDLFDSSITFQNYPVDEVVSSKEWQLKVSRVETHPHTNYPLTIIISIAAETSLLFSYNSALLDEVYIERIAGHFRQVLEEITTHESATIGAIELLTPVEKEGLLQAMPVPAPQETTITDLFEAQVALVPTATAVVYEEGSLTYQQLEEKANQLAHHLRRKGVGPGTLVPLCMDRSLDMLAGIMGILKAGCAYVPIEPDFPSERINYMLSDTGAKVVVSSCADKLPDNVEVVTMDDIYAEPVTRLPRQYVAGQLVYVIYTSGSTGNPKGVMVTHENLLDYVAGLTATLPVKECASFGLLSSIATDLGNTVIYASLATGGALHVFSKAAINDAEEIGRYLSVHRIDCVKIVPSHWKALSCFLPEKLLIFGGEALNGSLIDTIRSSGSACMVVNHYGPTETTIGKLLHIVDKEAVYEENVPVGKPFSHTVTYVLSPSGKICPVGVPGELYIGGAGVAAGYLNNEVLTAAKFVENPFGAGKLYRTGDQVKYLPDGNILFLGRIDDQVKIRGYRVELGEVESVLSRCDLIDQAVVVARADAEGNKRLIGYILPSGAFDSEGIQAYLKASLPDHMHPSLLIALEQFPFMANGKVDKKSLPDPDMQANERAGYTAPRTLIEERLAVIWSNLLEVDRISVHDDFFALGGHSLLAIRLISAIRKELSVEVSIGDVFDYPTIAQLSAQLQRHSVTSNTPALTSKIRPAHIPLSFSQERLWFIDQMEGSVHYHVPTVLRLKGVLDKDALSYAMQTIVDRHEVLRTVIEQEDGQAYQRVNAAGKWELDIIDKALYRKNETALQESIAQLINTPFDLEQDYMLRVHLIALGEEEHILVVILHHIASDAWSTGIIVKELVELYAAYTENRAPQLPVPEIQYADYAIWQREYLSGAKLEKELGYWKDKLSDVTALELPTDYPRPAVQPTRGGMYSFRFDKQLSVQLQALSQQQGTTLFMTLLAAFKVLLYRYSGQEDICVGIPVAGRTQQETEGLIGFFINTLALRSDLSNDPSFITLLQQVKQTTLGAYEHQEIPFEKIVDAVVKERDVSRTPLFQVMFVLQNAPEGEALKLGDVKLSEEVMKHTTARFDLSCSLIESADGIMGSVEYCLDLFREETIHRMLEHFEQLLKSIADQPSRTIGMLPILSAAEQEQLLQTFNNTATADPLDETILDLFDIQVAMRPNAVALVAGKISVTYKVLNERANQLAHFLSSKGVKAESIVPVCLERSADMVLAILAVLKAGAAYVPVDPAYPADRIRYMLEDTGATVVITSGNILTAIADVVLIKLDEDLDEIRKYPAIAPGVAVTADSLAYVIYTSGSTGQPKGVMIEHHGLANLVHWHVRAYQVTFRSKATAVSGVGFDAFGWEVWPYLATGAAVHLLDDETRLQMSSLVMLHLQQGITHAFIPTALVQEFIQASSVKITSLQYLLTGGDQLSATDISGLTYKVVNNYGPTENSVVTTSYELLPADRDHAPVIGRPVSNTRVYILNSKGQLCPVGVAGEICIAGSGLSRGYLNLTALTTEKFVSDPFGGGTMYRTGDLGRWLQDGTIEYAGRIDEQVKIRGYRIEPGEIESVLSTCTYVRQAVVSVKTDAKGNKRLVGYVVPDGIYDKTAILSYLKSRLPDYMVPSLLMELDKIPLTANGKIDRKALPDPEASALLTNEYIAPRNETEASIAGIWQELLGVEQVGIHDNFFELGGNSLLVMRMVALMRSRLQIEVPIRTIFSQASIAQLSDWLTASQGENTLLPAIEIQTRPARIPLSFSQERLWFIDQLEGSVQYHIPLVLRLSGDLNITALENSLQQIVNRHEVLRTVIREEEGVAYQQVLNKDSWSLSVTDNGSPAELENYITALIRTPFDLSADHMLRAHLIRLPESRYLLVLTMHHIAADGWSMGIATREVMELYNAYVAGRQAQLAPTVLQYADFAIWQRAYLSGEVLAQKLAYWKNKLEGVTPLELPTDYTPPVTQSMRGARMEYQIDKTLLAGLNQLSRQQGATLYMTLLAAFKVLLHRYSGQDDISVGTSSAGRQQHEIEGLIGFFINTLTLRSELGNNPSFTTLLQQVKQTTLGAFEHQDVPFEKIVEAVVKDRDQNRRPLFQVMFVMDNTPAAEEFSLDNVRMTADEITHTTARFNIILSVTEDKNGALLAGIEYAKDLFSESTIQRMFVHFEQLLKAIVASPQQQIGRLQMLTPDEQRKQITATVSYPRDYTFIDWFESAVAHSPQATALVFEGKVLTYRQLDEQSAQLAHYLRSKGVTANTLVPVCIERSLDMIVAVLGILRAGGAYVPVEPDFPAERIRYMLADTAATVIVSSSTCKDVLPVTDLLDIILLDQERGRINAYSIEAPLVLPTPADLAYVIYTSGSTGMPKGVMITHHNLADYIAGLRSRLPIGQCHSFGLLSSIATDLGNTVLFPALVSGAALHLFSKAAINDAQRILSYFETHEIDCIKIVPSHWKALSEPGRLLLPEKLLIFGGEALENTVVDSIRNAGAECTIVNHYGPTETTIGKLLHIVKQDAVYGPVVPVGRPFSNTSVYVLSPEMQLCPAGVPGELYIGGEGVAKGYLHNETLTAGRFVDNTFSTGDPYKLYRTGDRVKYLPDGDIIFLGRMDDQVKIRGYRVEPGEISRVMEQCELVSQGLVIAREDNSGYKRLIGYVIPAGTFDREGILSYLREQLPEYMVPAALVELEQFPFLANGKVDKKALPDPDNVTTTSYAVPETTMQKGLAAMWSSLLEVEQVGLHDDFFALGGHSLLAIRLISAIRKQLNLEVSIGDIFDYPTIAALSAKLETNSEAALPAVIRRERPAQIPLSFSQERLWFIDQLEGSVHYHLPTVLRLKGKLDRQALARAAQSIVNRHEVLRTVIEQGNAASWQRVMAPDQWQMQIIDDPRYKTDTAALNAFVEELVATPFDLSHDYMLRLQLIVLGEEDHIAVATMHHIASDGWSAGIIVRELVALYEAYSTGREPQLPVLELQYADYAIWQREYLSGAVLEEQQGYWENNLAGVTALQLPADYPRPAVQSSRGAVTTFHLGRELSEQLYALSQQEGVTLFMTLLASFQVLLYRYSGQEDICVGSPMAGRTRQELEGLIGFFINTLALRSDLSDAPTFTSLLQQVKQTTLGAYAHQEVPFEKIVDVIVKNRDLTRNPIFQVALVLQNTPDIPDFRLGELQMSEEGADRTTSKLDLTVIFQESPEGLAASVEYCTDLFNADTIERMITHFRQLLVSIVKAPATKISVLPMLNADEERHLLNDFNNTAVAYPENKTIIELFTEQVESGPDKTAVLFKDKVLAYKELDEWSNRLGHYLQSKGVKEEIMVPVCIPRSLEMMAAILGILKAGGAYVPLDPAYPAERIGFMLSESNSPVLLTTSEYAEQLHKERPDMELICMDEMTAVLSLQHTNPVQNHLTADNLAYVIYTSGSTGKPKGVMVNHRNVTSLVMHPNYVSLKDTDAILSAGSLSFDATTFEYWGMLLNGGRLVLSPENSLLDTDVLKQELYDKQITVLFITTGWFNQLVDTDISVFAKLSAILTGGEKMSEKHVERCRNAYPHIKISNIYGPTENTTFSLSYPISGKVLNMSTPIGRPLNNRTAYVLDAVQQLVPVGVVGELYVGGAGVSRGYLNRPELTEERFVPHPFRAGEKIYKTGDLARWLADGSIEYLGRVDDQVKVRGFRIEPGEIESVLRQSILVNQAVVIAKTADNGYKRLIGYIVPAGIFDRDGILDYLKNRLPEYMIPSLLIELEKLPITTNGKIDKKALPDPDSSNISVNEYVAPRTGTEQKLADIWKELLDMEKVGIHDNFFESGGNSLLAIHLISVIRKGLTADLAISDIFDYPTIASLAVVLDQRALAAAVSQHDNGHILLLNKGQQETPVFFIPGGNGICDGYSVLGEAVEEMGALYGLQMMGIFDGETPLDNIPAIAAQNIKWMKQVQPKGPYRLIGHSLGGQIGYEMTLQLERNGEQVQTLFILDTHVAPKRTILADDILFESLVEAFELYKIIGKPHPGWMATLKTALSKLQPREIIPFVITFVKEHVKEEKEHLGFVLRMFNMAAHSLFMEYKVEGKINTALTIIKSAARVTDDNDPALGWTPFATNVKTYTAPGDHISMTKEEGAFAIARYLKEQLNDLKPHHQ